MHTVDCIKKKKKRKDFTIIEKTFGETPAYYLGIYALVNLHGPSILSSGLQVRTSLLELLWFNKR